MFCHVNVALNIKSVFIGWDFVTLQSILTFTVVGLITCRWKCEFRGWIGRGMKKINMMGCHKQMADLQMVKWDAV